MKKIVLPGLLVGFINLIVGFAVSDVFMLIPRVAADYHNSNVMRPWSDPVMSLFFLYPFVQGVILAWAWDKTKTLFHGSTAKRGLFFGLSIFLVAGIPGMLVSYSSFQLSLLTIVSWLIGGLLNGIIAGLIFGKLNR